MPIYEYCCPKCGEKGEILVRSSEWDQARCPECDARGLEKQLSVFAATGAEQDPVAACSGNPTSCGRCGPM